MRRQLAAVAVALVALAIPTTVLAHEMDHMPPAFAPQSPPSSVILSGGTNARWELVGTIATGNPHTDLDFFTQKGETYVSVGTLAAGPNAGGQSIVKLTDKGQVRPTFVKSAPTASCVSNPSAATALQHDVEAAPKGDVIFNSANPYANRRDAQLIVDATDGVGRCHDQGTLGLSGAPQGGLEIIDVTEPTNPTTIGLTSHIGQAHTVNVDPKRPHIAYAVTSDTVTVTQEKRQNEVEGSADQNDLDGFEVVDMSSCMNFPAGTSAQAKRDACRPTVYRYRWPTRAMADGHTDKQFVFGCHELEVYANDRLVCGAGAALLEFDMKGAFDDNGTPTNFNDDKPRGTPLPCRVRNSSSAGPFSTAAKVTDCHNGGADGMTPLNVPGWLKIGAPSLDGVRYLGSIHHEGGHPSTATDEGKVYDSTQDIAFNHESELTHSGNFLLATDERGGGVTPPGASCSQANDNKLGNGGIHAFKADSLRTDGPGTAEQSWASYAKTTRNEKAIYRAPIRTGAQATVCTAHVMQQIPGQNRIFMGWYSQGTQVVDYTENSNGTLDFKEAAYLIPANANTWTSHVFKAQENPDGTFTYWGATGDFNLGERGRNSIDVYRVTLPAPPKPANGPGTGGGDPRGGAPRCVVTAAFRRASARPRGGGLRFDWATFPSSATGRPTAQVDVFAQSVGRRIVGERRVASFGNRARSFTWNGRGRGGRRLPSGFYVARFRSVMPNGQFEYRRFALERRGGRFRPRRSYYRRDSCGALRSFKLERPVFGGRTNRALNAAFRLGAEARVSVVVTVGRRVVKRFRARTYAPGRTHRLRIVPSVRRRSDHKVRITVTSGGRTTSSSLTARRL